MGGLFSKLELAAELRLRRKVATLQHPPMQEKKEIEGPGLSRLEDYNIHENWVFSSSGAITGSSRQGSSSSTPCKL